MTALLAAAPLAVILLGMGVLRRSAALAGAVGLLVALALTVTLFRPVAEAAGGVGTTLGGAGAEALHTTATILWIILPALAIYEYQRQTGAIERIRDSLAGIAEEPRLQAILIAWFFGLFMEGAAGFGTPVALAAPLLVGLGYTPVTAVALALLGHAAGVSFGAVGTPVLTQAAITGLDPGGIATATAALHVVAGPVLLIAMVRLAGEGRPTPAERAWTLVAALCFLVPSLALAALVGPELATLGAALVGVTVFVGLLRWRRPQTRAPDLRRLLPDLAPYLVILALVLVTRLVPGLREALSGLAVGWRFAESFSGSFQPLYHPGTILFAGLLAGALAAGRIRTVGTALGAGLQRVLPVALALLVMLALSRLMVHSGMIAALAAAALQVGPAWPLVAPFMGILGTFITGSATASNILFSELQVETAAGLALPPVALAAAQSFGAAVGNVIAPHNIIAGSATVGLSGREGDILARTARPCLVYGFVGGAILLAVLQAI